MYIYMYTYNILCIRICIGVCVCICSSVLVAVCISWHFAIRHHIVVFGVILLLQLVPSRDKYLDITRLLCSRSRLI